jgi:uncharacterized protein YkwD
MQRCLLVAAILAFSTLETGGTKQKPFMLTEDESSLLELTNAERRKEGFSFLKPNPVLFEVARAHSANMAKQGKLEHKLDGKSPFERIKAPGYAYTLAAENLARGDVTVAEIVQAWMKSKVHRENILEKEFTETGIGVVRDGMGDTYYTQIFANPQK